MDYSLISGFPDVSSYVFPELNALANVWIEKRDELEGTPAHAEFLRKLQREWAIETGIIERLYTWDRGVTQILIEEGIQASLISHHGGLSQDDANYVQAIIGDQLGIVEGLFAYVKGDEPLTEHFIRGLQAKFTSQQETTEAMTAEGLRVQVRLLKGGYKTQPNNPKRADGSMHAYCPPEITRDEMQRLVQIYRNSESKYEPVVLSAWLHHRFTQIHPFQDGNGRVARALASLVFLRARLFPLVIREADREEYIAALELADDGDLLPLCRLFAKRQRDAILRSLGLEQQAQRNQFADQIIASTLKVLKDRFAKETASLKRVYEFATRVEKIAKERLDVLADTLDKQLHGVTPPGHHQFLARCASSEEHNKHWFYQQIVLTAKQLGYFANLDSRREWVRLSITTSQSFDYVLSFHGLGAIDSGILVVSAFTYLRAPREEGGTEPVSLHPAAPELFQFNYAEPLESIEVRFNEWLESSLAVALAEWKRTIQ